MKIALTYNPLPERDSRYRTDEFSEFDDPSTIATIRKAIESLGHRVVLIEASEDAFEKLRNSKPDFVFNIAEGIRGRSRESQIPAMLDMLGIPYSGSGVATLALTLDKRRTKEILKIWGIPTPKFQLFSSEEESLNGLKFPLFVKPNAEGSSKGITKESLVKNKEQLRNIVNHVVKKYHQPALVEEYLPGREFTVSMVGNNPPRVLPLVEVDFNHLPGGLPKFDSYEVKWYWDSPGNDHGDVICPAVVDGELEVRLKETALKTFKVLDCLDFCRIDMRLDSEGVPNVMDVNALPGLIPDPRENSRFPKAAYAAGLTYDEMIAEILHSAFARYNL